VRAVDRMYPNMTFLASARRAPASKLIAASRIMSVAVGVGLWYKAWRIIEDDDVDHPRVIRMNLARFLFFIEGFFIWCT